MIYSGYLAAVVAFLTLVSHSPIKGEQCALLPTWNRHWFAGYESNQAQLEYFNDTMRIEHIVVASGTIDDSDPFVSLCEDSEVYEEVEDHTVIAYKRKDDNKRYCFNGIDRGDVLLYKVSEPETVTAGYTADICYGLLTDSGIWQALINYQVSGDTLQFQNPRTDYKLDSGTYQLTYKNGDAIERCTPPDDTSTVIVTSTTMAIRSCSSDNTYDRPLQTDLVIVGYFSDKELDVFDSLTFSGMVILGYPDDTAPLGYYFYIAKFYVESDRRKMTLMFTTHEKDKPFGYTEEQIIPPGVLNSETMFYYLWTNECETSTPCMNGGTCQQLFQDYECECVMGFTGKDCDDDKDECMLTVSPCNNNGDCIDELNKFSCECHPGWGGEFCDEVDPCNPNPCDFGECIKDISDYYCACFEDYYGRNCSFEDYCVDSDKCENGGTCHLSYGQEDFKCVCTPLWTGKQCQEPYVAPTGPGPALGACLSNADCDHEGICEDGQCLCFGFWTGARCQDTALWFITSIALIALLALLLIIILVVCCCCCCGGGANNGESSYGAQGYQNNDYATMEAKSLDGVGPAPGTVQFNMIPPQLSSATYNSVLTSTR